MMKIPEAVNFLDHDAIANQNPATWADLGCGKGLFTYALANLLHEGSTIYAVDKDLVQLNDYQNQNQVSVVKTQMNFITDVLPFEKLDGILMANSLHFVKDKISLIRRLGHLLNPAGIFLIVEYDTDAANPWVPYPVSFVSLGKLFHEAGYPSVEKIHEAPSIYNRAQIYSAVIQKA